MSNTTGTPTQRRMDALNALSHSVVEYSPEARANDWRFDFADREVVAEMIRALAPLGRTDGWKVAVQNWSAMVSKATDAREFEWAFLQGSINTGWAV